MRNGMRMTKRMIDMSNGSEDKIVAIEERMKDLEKQMEALKERDDWNKDVAEIAGMFRTHIKSRRSDIET